MADTYVMFSAGFAGAFIDRMVETKGSSELAPIP